MSILNHSPGPLRKLQADFLQWAETNWDRYDVFVVNAPVASGKSWMAITLARWLESKGKSTALLAPTKQLQDQYSAEFPEIASLKGKDTYSCLEDEGDSCLDRSEMCGGQYCDECPYLSMKVRAMKEPVGIFNYHTYLFHEMYLRKDVAIFDEAHNLPGMISGMSELKLWQHKEKFDKKIVSTHGDLVAWLEGHITKLSREESLSDGKEKIALHQRVRNTQRVLEDLRHNKGDFYYSIDKELYRGKEMDCLKIVPLSIKNLPPRMWPKFGQVRKIVLMSATLDAGDIADMSLNSRRVGYFECDSPIPVTRRPFVADPCTSMAWAKRTQEMPKIATRIQEYAVRHPNEKGLVHCTYGTALALREYLQHDPRFVWHDNKSKQKQYQAFRDSSDPLILMASGMSEGIDLAYDVGRWQVILQLPYPSFGDPWVKRKAGQDKGWYARTTARIMEQQTGRICRSPTDYGVTYMIDDRFMAFYYKNIKQFDRWFTQSVINAADFQQTEEKVAC